jgi:hypothetical protein
MKIHLDGDCVTSFDRIEDMGAAQHSAPRYGMEHKSYGEKEKRDNGKKHSEEDSRRPRAGQAG